MFCAGQKRGRRRTGRGVARSRPLLPLACAALGFPLGCASAGQPRPPSLHLPAQAQKLVAERVGDQVALAWTTPSTTTDGESIRGPVSATICLESGSAAAAPAPATTRARRGGHADAPAVPALPCQVLTMRPASPGPARITVALPAALLSGVPALVSVRVVLSNANGHSAGPSAPAYVAAGAPPPAVGPLRVTGRREGALVQWKTAAGASVMEMKRTLVSGGGKTAPAADPAANASAEPVAVKGAPTQLLPGGSRRAAREAVFRPESTAETDPGGMIDRTVQDGASYVYVAQRVESVSFGGRTLELRGSPSPPASFSYRDVFPPRAPTGLVLVPGGGFGQPASIDLSWDANPESDILGYNIYRADSGGEFVRRNPEAVAESAFRDLSPQAGHTYRYRVTAVDNRRNESAPGAEVRGILQP